MSRSVKQEYDKLRKLQSEKRVITLPTQKIVWKNGEGFVIEDHPERDTLSEQS